MMKIGQKVSLKKYKTYNHTETHKYFGYTPSMIRLANSGVPLIVKELVEYRPGVLRVRLEEEDGTVWAFHKSDIVVNFKLENK